MTNQPDANLIRELDALLQRSEAAYSNFLGFPAALDFDYTPLAPMLQRFLNNVGDPMVEPWIQLESKAQELEVLTYFASLFRAPHDNWWGYMTNGSTECNLYALYLARQKYPEAIVYYSDTAHYSIPKNIHILGQQGAMIPSDEKGEMDYDALLERLREHADRPAIVVATIGTTMTEAKDNVQTITNILGQAGISQHYIHADAALAGPYTALIEPRHPFDFQDGADSISVSGHKFFGTPTPCGVVIVRKEYKELLGDTANYTGSIDTTISGSRNGHTPLMLWYALRTLGRDGVKQRALECMAMADYAYEQIKATGWTTWRNPQALTVMIARPPHDMIIKWQLASAGDWSHIICMPGITKDKIDRFASELTALLSSSPSPQEQAHATA